MDGLEENTVRRPNVIKGRFPIFTPVMHYAYYILQFEESVADLSDCYAKAFQRTFSQFGIPYDPDRLYKYIETPLDVLFMELHTGCTCKYRDFAIKFTAEFDRAFPGFRIRDGAAMRIRGLRDSGASIALISKCYSSYVASALGAAGLTGCFDQVVTGELMTSVTHDADFLERIMSAMDADPGRTAIITSNPELRMNAEKAGIAVVSGL